MNANKLIHHHALKISTDKQSCQISSRDRPIQTLNFQLETLISVVAEFICSQKAKAQNYSDLAVVLQVPWQSELWSTSRWGAVLGWAVAEIVSQLFCRQDFYRLPSCRLCSGGVFETSGIWHFIFPFAQSLCLLIWLRSTRPGEGRKSLGSLYH